MIKHIRRFFWWLFGFENLRASFYGLLVEDRQYVITVTKNSLEEALKVKRSPVYVTLRGFYIRDGLEVAHGWTQRVDLDVGDQCTLPFKPYSTFRCERVDILGPAEITGVNIGNETLAHPKFQSSATFEFRATCEVGNYINVYLKGFQ